jgi:hypothetical protein
LQLERAVLDELVYTEVEKIDGEEQFKVIANAAYSYNNIQTVARKVAQRPEFRDEKLVRPLMFSNKWVGGWLRRQVLRRRRVTAEDKKRPSIEVIRADLQNIQDKVMGKPTGDGDDRIVEKGPFTPDQTISADETGIFYGAPPLNQYVPHDTKRGAAPASDVKARLTSLQAATAAGNHIGSFNIIKCSVKDPYDLSSARVISNLHKKPGFTAEDGWELREWERTIEIRPRGKKKVSEGALFCMVILHVKFAW